MKPFQIPSGSMLPTLEIGERVLVDRVQYRFGSPGTGDIVVFHPPRGEERCGVSREARQPCPQSVPEHSETNFIKRVIAVPGDRLRVEDGVPIVNGEPIDPPNWETAPCGGGPDCNLTEEITIPPDHYFMMGDNRGVSTDSRFFGPVHRDWIVGKAVVTYWPPSEIGIF